MVVSLSNLLCSFILYSYIEVYYNLGTEAQSPRERGDKEISKESDVSNIIHKKSIPHARRKKVIEEEGNEGRAEFRFLLSLSSSYSSLGATNIVVEDPCRGTKLVESTKRRRKFYIRTYKETRIRNCNTEDTEEESLETASKRNEARYEGNLRKDYKVWDSIRNNKSFLSPYLSSFFKFTKEKRSCKETRQSATIERSSAGSWITCA